MLLARTFRWADVDAFLGTLTPEQFDEWRAEYELGPWGEERGDLRIANLVIALEQVLVPFGHKPQLRHRDLMPYTEFPDERDPVELEGWEDAALQQEKLLAWKNSTGA